MAAQFPSVDSVDRGSKAGSRKLNQLTSPAESSGARILELDIRLISISAIRRDGGAQHRIAPDVKIIDEYAQLMRDGVEFPPISVRQDGMDYWPSDGFQRIQAANLAGLSEIRAEIRPGTREDAQWDSYAANATHGMRRTATETEKVIELALQHPNAKNLTDVSISKHLHVPRTTVQYWRKKLSCQSCQDGCIRTVTRGDCTYELRVTNLGRKKGERRTDSRRDQEVEIAEIRKAASPPVQGMLNVLEKWARHQLPPARLLEHLENKMCRGRSSCPFR